MKTWNISDIFPWTVQKSVPIRSTSHDHTMIRNNLSNKNRQKHIGDISYADNHRLRPYHVEYTSFRPITEVKQRRAGLVLGWVTAWEYPVS